MKPFKNISIGQKGLLFLLLVCLTHEEQDKIIAFLQTAN